MTSVPNLSTKFIKSFTPPPYKEIFVLQSPPLTDFCKMSFSKWTTVIIWKYSPACQTVIVTVEGDKHTSKRSNHAHLLVQNAD